MRPFVCVLGALPLWVWGQDTDLFNYNETVGRNFGPKDWDQVECDNLETCTGWPEKWLTGVDWELEQNDCRDCSEAGVCDLHHQSPIALERKWGLEVDDDFHDGGWKNCTDWHWMKYEDSSCDFNDLKKAQAFSVERHALRAVQPLDQIPSGEYRLDCKSPDGTRRFGRIDFSKGFWKWWFLSHTEIKVPSEHIQNGKRYDAEVQLGHFYSHGMEPPDPNVTDSKETWNQMATVSIFLQAVEKLEPYPLLDKYICQWRHAEDKTREGCGLPSVPPYPGCFNHNRQENTGRRRQLRTANATKTAMRLPNGYLEMDPENWRNDDWTNEDWKLFMQEYSRTHPLNSSTPYSGNNGKQRRRLIDYDHVPFNNYGWMLDVRTEYYYRYEGTQTIPPCYAEYVNGGPYREKVNNWRVMKDPIRVHPRQIAELQRLLKERYAPANDVNNPCQPDTAGKIGEDGSISVARPLQEISKHRNTFCECRNWGSKWDEDVQWCRSGDMSSDYRWYENPYNFKSDDKLEPGLRR